MVRYLPQPERKPFLHYLKRTLDKGLNSGMENVYIVDISTNSDYCRHILGNENEIAIPETVSKEIEAQEDDSLSMFHNHPNSTIPSKNDYIMFFKYAPIINMAVCGHVGNLYFMRKSDRFYSGTKERLSDMLSALEKRFGKLLLAHLVSNGYNWEQFKVGNETFKQEYARMAMDTLFDELGQCGFSYYRERD